MTSHIFDTEPFIPVLNDVMQAELDRAHGVSSAHAHPVL